jgi:drug/metabolite transporter (DMT)-like permease
MCPKDEICQPSPALLPPFPLLPPPPCPSGQVATAPGWHLFNVYAPSVIADVRRAFVGEGTLTERQGAILVALSGVVFSSTAIAHEGVDAASDFQFLTYRGMSTFGAMVLLVGARRRGRPVKWSGLTGVTWLASLVLAATSMLYILALSRTSAATTLSLLAAAPISAAILGWILLRERVERATLVAIGGTAVGVAITVGAGLEVGSGLGLLFAGLIPVTIGLYSVLMRSARSVDPVVPTLLAGGFLGVGSAIAALVIDGSLAVSPRDALMATISGGVALGIGLPMFNLGHRSVSAARVPLLLMTEVVLAPLWVWIWPGQTPSLATLAGGAVILASVGWLVRRTTRDTLDSSDRSERTPDFVV